MMILTLQYYVSKCVLYDKIELRLQLKVFHVSTIRKVYNQILITSNVFVLNIQRLSSTNNFT